MALSAYPKMPFGMFYYVLIRIASRYLWSRLASTIHFLFSILFFVFIWYATRFGENNFRSFHSQDSFCVSVCGGTKIEKIFCNESSNFSFLFFFYSNIETLNGLVAMKWLCGKLLNR